jgi:hypothetical protein
MRRRTLLQWILSTAPALPFTRVRLGAQPRELTPEAVTTLRALGTTVLPASIGAARVSATIDRFIEWTRHYREGVPTSHGYGHPRLERTAASPAPDYVAQLAALDAAAEKRGARFGALDLEARRDILHDALAAANVRTLPGRPTGQHVATDLMGFYFRSSEAADQCYQAAIGRQMCRPIQITTKRPAALA